MGSECGVRVTWLAAALVAVTVVTLVGYLVTRPPALADPGVAPTASEFPTVQSASTPAEVRVATTAGLQEAVAEFLAAWSTVDPEQRAIGLAATATASLAEQLLVTDPDEVPPACVFAGALEVADLTPIAVLVTVPTTCEGVLWVGLDRDSTGPHGWRVTAIGKERSWIQ